MAKSTSHGKSERGNVRGTQASKKDQCSIDRHRKTAHLPLPFAVMPSIFSWKECASWIPRKWRNWHLICSFWTITVCQGLLSSVHHWLVKVRVKILSPEAPVATGNWGRASGYKNTWIPCPPRVWSELKSMTMEDVQQAAVQRRNSKKRRFK